MSGECDYCGSDQHVETACPQTKDPAVMWQDGYASGYAAGWNANNQRSAFATPPPGHIIDDTGTVRKVLGTLPLTADGCVVMPGNEVFHPNQDKSHTLRVMEYMDDMEPCDEFPLPDDCEYIAHYSYYEHDCGYSQWETYDVRACYSTEQAAREAGGEA